MFIRNAQTPTDWQWVRAICVATGAAGQPITATRAPFFGDYWVGPYEQLLPEWTYVAETPGAQGSGAQGSDEIVGYLTGCPDTAAFERRKRWLCTAPLFARTVLGFYGGKPGRGYAATGDTRRFIRRTLGLDPEPNSLFSAEVRERISRDYPAHLHVNLGAASARGKGVGRQLTERFFDDLRRARVRGVHVHCGQGPVPFYLKLGFKELGRHEFKPGVWIYAMGRALH